MASAFTTLLQRAAHRRALRELMRLDDRLLRDIGVTRADLAFMITSGPESAGRRDV